MQPVMRSSCVGTCCWALPGVPALAWSACRQTPGCQPPAGLTADGRAARGRKQRSALLVLQEATSLMRPLIPSSQKSSRELQRHLSSPALHAFCDVHKPAWHAVGRLHTELHREQAKLHSFM